jgi:hypothetical protein
MSNTEDNIGEEIEDLNEIVYNARRIVEHLDVRVGIDRETHSRPIYGAFYTHPYLGELHDKEKNPESAGYTPKDLIHRLYDNIIFIPKIIRVSNVDPDEHPLFHPVSKDDLKACQIIAYNITFSLPANEDELKRFSSQQIPSN